MPAEAGSLPKSYVLIYDAVPGGTGYLQQLLAGQADTLTEVLKSAFEAISTCSCIQNPELDGCYRCVYQHRQGSAREHISRRRAHELLDELLNGDFKFTEIKTLSEIYVDNAFGSELERRFLLALTKVGGLPDVGNSRLPGVSIVKDVVDTETAYLMTVGAHRYWIRKQVEIKLPGSATTTCQPDFLIAHSKSGSAMKPVAVFVDGWEFHKDITADDGRKRSALLASNSYHVWSVTHADIEEAIKGGIKTDLGGLPLALTPAGSREVKLAAVPSPSQGSLQRHAVAELIALLGASDPLVSDPLRALDSTAKHLVMKTILHPAEVSADEALKGRNTAIAAAMPHWLEIEGASAFFQSSHESGLQIVGEIAASVITGKTEPETAVIGAIVLREPSPTDIEVEARMRWRQWLRAFNILQVLPRILLTTEGQLGSGDIVVGAQAPAVVTIGALSARWNAALDQVIERMRPGLAMLGEQGAPHPDEIGPEVEDELGYRFAEVLWRTSGVVLLLKSQSEYEAAWVTSGHKVIIESPTWQADLKKVLVPGDSK